MPLDEQPQAKKWKGEDPNPEVSRSIAACQRCRSKKIKCDRNFPQCTKCKKAGLDCVGIDPATGRVVPRSYVAHLEERIFALERQLEKNGINKPPIANIDTDSPQFGSTDPHDWSRVPSANEPTNELVILPSQPLRQSSSSTAIPLAATLHANHSESSYLGASLGITFAKLMMAAVKFKDNKDPQNPVASINTSLDSRSAVLPPKATAQNFIRIYFNQSNTQLPILHREVFFKTIFEPIYGSWDPEILMPSMTKPYPGTHLRQDQTWLYQYKQLFSANLAEYNSKVRSEKGVEKKSDLEILQTISNSIEVPKRFQRPLYYLNLIFAIASSSNHLQYMNSISEQFRNAAMKFIGSTAEINDPMEELQSSLLLTLYSLMRPCVDGVWYILGKCLRLCVDLGLHNKLGERTRNLDAFTKDRRRRLFWCTYSLDRQVCFYLGRPVGIPESSIDVAFPSMLEDSLIHKQNTLDVVNQEILDVRSTDILGSTNFQSIKHDTVGGHENASCIRVQDYSNYVEQSQSYKYISAAFFKIRQIQLEVQRILYEDEDLPQRFDSVQQWKAYILDRLQQWLNSLPQQGGIAQCDFHFEFFLLNYNHTLLMINGLSPKSLKLSQSEYQLVADSLRNIMRCYTQLFVKKAINYTWAAVHNLFMAGTSFLFVLYHSDEIRLQYEMHQVMKITGDCISILSLLVVSCDAAKSCSETFQVLTAAVLKLRYDADVDASYENNNFKSPKSSSDRHESFSGTKSERGFEPSSEDPSSTIDPRNAFGSNGSNYNEEFEGLEDKQQFQQAKEENIDASSGSPELFGLPDELEYATDGVETNQTPVDFVPQFEWISRKSSEVSDTFENSIYANGKNLETFFSEVANLSPISSVRDYSGEKNGTLLETRSEGASGSKLPQKEAKKVFELIQQVPTESIWDQFFTKPQGAKFKEEVLEQ